MSNQPEKCIRCGEELTGWNCGDEWRATGICCECWTEDDFDDELDPRPENAPEFHPWNIDQWG